MNMHRIRNAIPPVYALLIVVGFVIGTAVGVIVLIAAGMLSGVLWSMLSRGGPAGTTRERGDRSAARSARRTSRR